MDLTLYEEALLLALHDDKGTAHATVDSWHALAAAVLAELILAGRLAIVPADAPPKERRLVATDAPDAGPLDDPLLERWRRSIAEAPETERPSAWATNLAADKDLRHDAARRLVERGVLHVEEDRILKVFHRTRYPEDDRGVERALEERLRRALFTDADDVSERTAALIAIARPTGMLSVHFGRAEVKQAEPRIEGLLAESAIARAVEAMLPPVG